ncbi:hypothetical protein BV898_15199 [Hypsibius exemplaris]|uniref:Uncharacterized protein n=1 Tax=Hypsibius exemplaris TaxID=2072580 RepID=A0A9X6RK69_HYPEX|nr:hypothetical protein BV898_15199 [Hypsibius exemplaris]
MVFNTRYRLHFALLLIVIDGSLGFKRRTVVTSSWTKTETWSSSWSSREVYNYSWTGWVDSANDLTKQLKKTSGKTVTFSSNDIADTFRSAVEDTAKASTRSDLPTLEEDSTGALSDAFGSTRNASLEIGKDAATLADFSNSIANTTLKELDAKAVGAALSKMVLPEKLRELLLSQQPGAKTRESACNTIGTEATEVPVVPIADWQDEALRPACVNNKYRNHTGYCNNVCFPTRGMQSTVFIRRLAPDYSNI